jgi:cytochrome c553
MRRKYFAVLCCMAVMPLAVFAASSVRQEIRAALHAKPNLDQGAEHFKTCTACHGPDGAGTLDGAVPRIGGQHFPVLVNQLVYFRHGERWDTRMEHFADQHHLTDVQAIADVAAYVTQLDPAALPGRGTGELVQRGGRVYFRLCETCHGRSGLGDAEHAVPQIAGQHYEYLRRQIYDAVDGRHPSFPAAHVRLLARLQHDDITGVADYLSRIAPRNARQLAAQRSTP